MPRKKGSSERLLFDCNDGSGCSNLMRYLEARFPGYRAWAVTTAAQIEKESSSQSISSGESMIGAPVGNGRDFPTRKRGRNVVSEDEGDDGHRRRNRRPRLRPAASDDPAVVAYGVLKSANTLSSDVPNLSALPPELLLIIVRCILEDENALISTLASLRSVNHRLRDFIDNVTHNDNLWRSLADVAGYTRGRPPRRDEFFISVSSSSRAALRKQWDIELGKRLPPKWNPEQPDLPRALDAKETATADMPYRDTYRSWNDVRSKAGLNAWRARLEAAFGSPMDLSDTFRLAESENDGFLPALDEWTRSLLARWPSYGTSYSFALRNFREASTATAERLPIVPEIAPEAMDIILQSAALRRAFDEAVAHTMSHASSQPRLDSENPYQPTLESALRRAKRERDLILTLAGVRVTLPPLLPNARMSYEFVSAVHILYSPDLRMSKETEIALDGGGDMMEEPVPLLEGAMKSGLAPKSLSFVECSLKLDTLDAALIPPSVRSLRWSQPKRPVKFKEESRAPGVQMLELAHIRAPQLEAVTAGAARAFPTMQALSIEDTEDTTALPPFPQGSVPPANEYQLVDDHRVPFHPRTVRLCTGAATALGWGLIDFPVALELSAGKGTGAESDASAVTRIEMKSPVISVMSARPVSHVEMSEHIAYRKAMKTLHQLSISSSLSPGVSITIQTYDTEWGIETDELDVIPLQGESTVTFVLSVRFTLPSLRQRADVVAKLFPSDVIITVKELGSIQPLISELRGQAAPTPASHRIAVSLGVLLTRMKFDGASKS